MTHSTLITGGLGFIGTRLSKSLLLSDKKSNLVILDHKRLDSINRCTKALLDEYTDRITLVNSDISDIDISELLEDVSTVVHLAANPGVQLSISDPVFDLQENLLNTIKILEAIRTSSRKVKLIFSSSAAPIAGCSNLPSSENDPIMPLSPYGASKASCEAYIQAYASAYGLESYIFRFSNVYGPGSLDKGSVVARMIKDSLTKGTITINGNGLQTRDFIYVDDLVTVLRVGISSRSSSAKPIHICSGQPSSILDISRMITSILHEKAGIDPHTTFAPALVGDAKK